MANTRMDLGRRAFLGTGCATMFAAACPALVTGAEATQTLSGPAFGTTWRVVLPGGADMGPLRAPVEALLAEIDAEMSPWRPDSLLSRINRTDGVPVAITAEFKRVAGSALMLAQQTGGAFDPTVGPTVAQWGFGPIKGGTGPWQGFRLDGAHLIKPAPDATLDLCGIAKGRALDRLGELLRNRGMTDALVEIGGEVLALGRHPSGRHWQVGVEAPLPTDTGLIGHVALDNAALATSGIKANSFMLGDRRYSHIVDPVERAPVTGALASVTVQAETAMQADGWATGLMAAGEDQAVKLAHRHGVNALLLIADARGLRQVTTGAFDLKVS